jgi:hypothetical protein
MAMNVKGTVFWDVTPFSLVHGGQCFKEICKQRQQLPLKQLSAYQSATLTSITAIYTAYDDTGFFTMNFLGNLKEHLLRSASKIVAVCDIVTCSIIL